MIPRRLGALALVAGLLAGCAGPTPAPTEAPAPAQSNAAAPSPTAHAAGVASDGTAIPGGKPTWLDILPDPASVDRTDPEAVIRAYVMTAATWDTTVDKTSAYATQRAAIYMTSASQKAAAAYDPDTAKAQGQFLQARTHQGFTTVTIRQVSTEGLNPDQDGDVHRIVHYLVTTTARDGAPARDVAWDAWVTATRENDHWAIRASHTTATQN